MVAGQAIITRAGERIRYRTASGARYVAVCLPAFAPRMPIATSRRDAARERMPPPLRHGRYIPADHALSAATIARAPKSCSIIWMAGFGHKRSDLAESAGYAFCQDAADWRAGSPGRTPDR